MYNGSSLEARRIQLGFTQVAIANKLHTSSQTISNIENGKNSSVISSYERLLVDLEQERMRALIGKYLVDGATWVVELLRDKLP